MTPNELRELVRKWRNGIEALKDGVKGSPSHDLHRLINERCEAFKICADELERFCSDWEKRLKEQPSDREALEIFTLLAHRDFGIECCGCLNVKPVDGQRWIVYCNECGKEVAAAGQLAALTHAKEARDGHKT